MTMDLDAKGATFDYDKMIVKNPERLNEQKKEILFVNNVPPSATGLDDDRVTVPEFEKAEVEDIVYDERL